MKVSNEEKKAVECGYSLFSADAIEEPLALLHIWHYNPAEEEEGVGSADNPAPVRKNGFHLDSKEPDWSKLLTVFNLGIRCSRPQLRDFIMGEARYNSLMKTFPQEAEELFVATERNAKLRYEGYKKLSEM